MICNYLVRTGKPCTEAVKLFAVHRHPGIYKDDYLEALFAYTHFQRCCWPNISERSCCTRTLSLSLSSSALCFLASSLSEPQLVRGRANFSTYHWHKDGDAEAA